MPDTQRIEWSELREGETFVVIADRDAAGAWRFFQRNAWEIHWYRVQPGPRLLAKAEQLSTQRGPLEKTPALAV